MKFTSRAGRKLLLSLASCLACNLFSAGAPSNTVMKDNSDSSSSKSAKLPSNRIRPIDLFDLEIATDPQISPDGARVVFVRNFNDIMKDRKRSNLWIVNHDGSDLRPLTAGNENDNSPRWSPNGQRLLYASTSDGAAQIYVRWMDSGQIAKVTRCPKSPNGMEWSPDGRWIAFAMPVSDDTKPFVEMPPKPEGADWAKPPKTIRRMVYRTDEMATWRRLTNNCSLCRLTGARPAN